MCKLVDRSAWWIHHVSFLITGWIMLLFVFGLTPLGSSMQAWIGVVFSMLVVACGTWCGGRMLDPFRIP